MRTETWIRVSVIAAIFSISAMADHGDGGRNNKSNDDNNKSDNNGSFASSIIGSTPGVTIGGVNSGGAPWTVSQGSTSLSSDGRLKIEVRGLLIIAGTNVPANLVGTTGPVQMVAGSVVCGGSGGTVSASTGGVTLSSTGNAEIDATVPLPASCMAPVVLVRIFNPAAVPASQLGPFIALTGLTASAPGVEDDDGTTIRTHK